MIRWRFLVPENQIAIIEICIKLRNQLHLILKINKSGLLTFLIIKCEYEIVQLTHFFRLALLNMKLSN